MPPEAEQAPANEQETSDPINAAPNEEGTPAEPEQGSQPAIDYEQRYNDLRPEFDRKNQLLSAAEGHHGAEAQAQALRQLGVEVELDEEPDDAYVDPDERIDRLEAQLQERQEAEKEAEFQRLESQYIKSTLAEIEGQEEIKLSDQETKLVVNHALANRLGDGKPDLQGAVEALKTIKGAARDEYLASQREKAKAPRAPVGTAGEEKIDLSDQDARQKWMAEQMQALEESE